MVGFLMYAIFFAFSAVMVFRITHDPHTRILEICAWFTPYLMLAFVVILYLAREDTREYSWAQLIGLAAAVAYERSRLSSIGS